MKKLSELERLAPPRRRQFLKLLGAALAAPLVPPAMRYAANAVAGGEAWAATGEQSLPTYLIEINLRDQWDHGHLMVAPGLATYADLRRGTDGRKAAVFFRPDELVLQQVNGTDVYLTAESAALSPHLDTVAMIDCCELGQGAIHGHESANPLRSPGRSYSQKPGAGAMWLNDPVDNFPQGCEAYFSTTPTPATLHNHHQHQIAPNLKQGIAFKGISRGIHTAYHYAASLGAGAELRRHYNRSTLFDQFPATVEDYNVVASQDEAEAIAAVLARVDPGFLERQRYSPAARDGHGAMLGAMPGQLYTGEPKVISLPLTADENAYWGDGVPGQVRAGPLRGEIWEQVAWAYKLVSNDLVRSIALEFDYVDQHDSRSENLLRTEAAQVALSVSRLIEKLKEASLYDRTVIAIYTTDGSRAPAGGSYGDEGKNTMILAGGGIRGGYYGDIQIAGNTGDGGHTYRYHAPDEANGAPRPGVLDNSSRLSATRVWRTVMKAACVPDSLCDSFPDVAGAAPLGWLLR